MCNNPKYELIRAKSEDNYHLPADYIATLRESYPPQLLTLTSTVNGSILTVLAYTQGSTVTRLIPTLL